jgi:hypothetical protein
MFGCALLLACTSEGADMFELTASGVGLETSGADEESDPPVLDLGGNDTAASGSAEGGEEGCEKVDLLFVIDNSGSMHDNQVNLVGSFPTLVQSMKDALVDVNDYHIGVVGTDDYEFNAEGCQSIGALVTQTGGENSSGGNCGPFSGGRFMTDNEADLNGAFACAAQMGSEGDGRERPMEALYSALNPGEYGLEACNEGFLRDDALLVVVVVTDAEDTQNFGGGFLPHSPGEPSDWFEWVKAAKGGIETNISVLSLVATPADSPYPDLCEEFGNETNGYRLIEFTEMFTHGAVASVCHSDYGEVFQDTVGVIESACTDFTPVD